MNVKESDVLAIFVEIKEDSLLVNAEAKMETFIQQMESGLASFITRRPNLKSLAIDFLLTSLGEKYDDLKDRLNAV